MAFDASADERDTRGFISMTIIRPVSGLTANWMFDPPVSTPTLVMILRAASRIRWYSLSESVRMGATVMLSPVCTPIGSMLTTDDHEVVGDVASPELEFLPADHRLTDQNLMHRGELEATPTRSPNPRCCRRCHRRRHHRERRPDDEGNLIPLLAKSRTSARA